MEGNEWLPMSEAMEAQHALLVDGDFRGQDLVDDGCNTDDSGKENELLHARMVLPSTGIMWVGSSGSPIGAPVPSGP